MKETIRNILNSIRNIFNSIGLDISLTDRGKRRWSGIVDDYYPINVRPRWGHGRVPHPQIAQLLISELPAFRAVLVELQKYKTHFAVVSYEQTLDRAPCWDNVWFSTLDAATLMYFILSRKPRIYLEVGSGYSTKFARAAITAGSPSTTLISIDPHPRREIDDLCDEVIRSPLEDVDLGVFDRLTAGDIAFFDGSHRVFTNSDTTVFFLDVLPRLKPGVLVHAHDVFWPDDYMPDWNRRLYSEQYLLGMLLLSGTSRYRVVLPNYFVSTNPVTASLIEDLGFPTKYPGSTKPGLSFWLEVL